MNIDLVRAFEHGLKAFDTPRGDEDAAHVSDLSKCLFEVWARRNGEPLVARSSKTRAMLQAGLRDEDWIVERIRRGLDPADGWHVVHGGTVDKSDLTGHMDVELARLKCAFCGQWEILAGKGALWMCEDPACESGNIRPYETEGVERRLFDVKTTEWQEQWVEIGVYPDTGKPKKKRVRVPWHDAPGDSAIMQAFGYVRRRPRNPDGKHMPFAILQLCRASLQIAQFPGRGEWYDGDDSGLLARHDQRTAEVIRQTAPGVDPVAAGIAVRTASGELAGMPREKWQCGYCSNAMCALNRNADNEVVPV